MKGPLMQTPGAILVVETDHTVADIIIEILRDEGYAVSVAHDRSGTLASIAKQRPALVLLDDYVAGLDAACLHAYVTQHYRVSIPIVTTTTNPAVATVLNAHDSWSCLVEPFALDALVAYVTHYVPLVRFATT